MKNSMAIAVPLPGLGKLKLVVTCAVVALVAGLLGTGWLGTASAQGQTACPAIDLGTLDTGLGTGFTANGRWSTEDCDSRFRSDAMPTPIGLS